MLATLDISSAKDDQGKVISFTPTFTMGVRYLTSSYHSILLSLTISLLQPSYSLPLQYFGTVSHSF
ncbi:hypothetical protein F4604DRAFT_1628512 [Suillus subluteus]|nr:hypothetical protein F4604DRAFT_1628512 [Suillus subluteus]